MTDNWRSFVAYYAVLVAFVLTAIVVIGGLLWLAFALVEWAVGAVMWLAKHPNERDIVTIGVLALVTLVLAEYRRTK